MSTINTADSQTYISKPREGADSCLTNSYLYSKIYAVDATTNNRHAFGKERWLVSKDLIASSSTYKRSYCRKEHLEDTSHAHVLCLMYKLLTTNSGCDDLSFGFVRNRDNKELELINNKTVAGKYHVEICYMISLALQSFKKTLHWFRIHFNFINENRVGLKWTEPVEWQMPKL